MYVFIYVYMYVRILKWMARALLDNETANTQRYMHATMGQREYTTRFYV